MWSKLEQYRYSIIILFYFYFIIQIAALYIPRGVMGLVIDQNQKKLANMKPSIPLISVL